MYIYICRYNIFNVKRTIANAYKIHINNNNIETQR